MKTVTWTKGSNKELDDEFDRLRDLQFNRKDHRLWKNYSPESFNTAVALTICWNDNDEPEICSSIAIRNCWPDHTYRILNRLWKHSNRIAYPRKLRKSFADTVISQINWLNNNVDCRLYFISRQTDNWEDWLIKNFKETYNLEFKTDNYKYLTCPNECDNTCWQKIIYFGDEQILDQWKRRPQ